MSNTTNEINEIDETTNEGDLLDNIMDSVVQATEFSMEPGNHSVILPPTEDWTTVVKEAPETSRSEAGVRRGRMEFTLNNCHITNLSVPDSRTRVAQFRFTEWGSFEGTKFIPDFLKPTEQVSGSSILFSGIKQQAFLRQVDTKTIKIRELASSRIFVSYQVKKNSDYLALKGICNLDTIKDLVAIEQSREGLVG